MEILMFYSISCEDSSFTLYKVRMQKAYAKSTSAANFLMGFLKRIRLWLPLLFRDELVMVLHVFSDICEPRRSMKLETLMTLSGKSLSISLSMAETSVSAGPLFLYEVYL